MKPLSPSLTCCILPLLVMLCCCSCKKEFLDARPSSKLVAPNTLADYQALLENVDVLNRATPALSQMACDDYLFVDQSTWEGTFYNAERNSYTWARDLYEGQKDIKDWNTGYAAIFVCNNVLEGLKQIPLTPANQQHWNQLRGWALFMRAYLLYDLVRNFSPAYDSVTASVDLGMPVRLKAGVDETAPRSTVEQTYSQVLADLAEASGLLLPGIAVNNRERPSRVAAMALFARIYLSMGKYDKAGQYAGSTLALYPALMDYNTLNPLDRDPFSINGAETILNTTVISNYYDILATGGYVDLVVVNPALYDLYQENDLRKTVFFAASPQTGHIYVKFGYAGPYVSPFTGLATDEVYLIKAECLARSGELDGALELINTLLKNRYRTGTFVPLTATSAQEALGKILLERRKELVWRSLRWTDLKRLNKEGANITLQREIGGKTYTLPPNDPRYVFPIPDDEIALSGIRQNIR